MLHLAVRYLLTGLLICKECGANFIARAVRNSRCGRYHYSGCADHARQGTGVCPNRVLLPQAAVERELLKILQREILTPSTLDRVLAAVNARLRAQATAVRPRVRELQRALGQVERGIANYTRAVARGSFASLERALTAAEQRRASLQTDLTQVTGRPQPATVQLTPAALEQHLQPAFLANTAREQCGLTRNPCGRQF